MKHLAYNIIYVGCLICVVGCSSQKNTWTSKAFHNTTAHYNGYYYSREEIQEIENTIWASLKNDYNRILKLYPSTDSTLAKSYDKEIQECIKMASIAIQRHPNSKWVDDCYLLVGKARLFSLDWGNAIQTFKFVNTKSKDPDARHKALILLIRTFVEHQEFNNAQAAIDFLQKEKLNNTNKKNLLLEKAYFYQVQGNHDYMVRNLAEADRYLKKKDRPGRIYFIVGQVYQKLGFESEAYNYYKKCIGTNPDYEIDFYARLYMAQVTEISRSKNVNAARKSFRKLLKDGKNKEFTDKIYYEMGLFELKQKDIPEAIRYFNRSVREGTNKRIDGEAFLKLGEIYYDSLKNYQLSQAYYDSAINTLPKDYEGYEAIKTRQQILNEFVKHLNTIDWQDSLLTLASLDSLQLRSKIDSAYQAKVAEEKKLAGKKRKRSKRVAIVANTNNVFSTGEEDEADAAPEEESGDWYFTNPTALAIGQTEFKRIWGEVPLEDNWRRSLRSSAMRTSREGNLDAATANNDSTQSPSSAEMVDPVAAEFDRVNKQIPRTEEQKKEAYKKIEDAYFYVADIYYLKLLEKENAVSWYIKLLERFPETPYEPEVLYRLYLAYKDTDPVKADHYASRLKRDHPLTTFAKILINPNYLVESNQAVEKQKGLYKKAYSYYEQRDYAVALNTIEEAITLGESAFIPNLKLLKILIIGKREDINQYQYSLDTFIKTYPDAEVTGYAKKLLETSREFQNTQEKRKGIQYIKSLDEPHYFVIVYKKEENMGNAASSALEKFNRDNFADLKLKTSNLVLNDDYIITLTADLPRVSSALEFIQAFNQKLPNIPELRNHKFDSFVITKDNFDIFYRTKGLDEYLTFFEKNYPAEIQ